MDTQATDVREMEIAHLDLRYAHTRILKREHLVSLAASIEQWGQIIPVVIVAPCVLVDGYRRVAALKLCKRDTVMAEHWSCGEREALFRVLRYGCERRWDVVEQAALIGELIDCHKMCRARVARQLGKTLLDGFSRIELGRRGRTGCHTTGFKYPLTTLPWSRPRRGGVRAGFSTLGNLGVLPA